MIHMLSNKVERIKTLLILISSFPLSTFLNFFLNTAGSTCCGESTKEVNKKE